MKKKIVLTAALAVLGAGVVGLSAGAFAIGKILTHYRQSHVARVSDFFPPAPFREFAQRSMGGKLIILRESALDGEKTNEGVDRIFHRGMLNQQYVVTNENLCNDSLARLAV